MNTPAAQLIHPTPAKKGISRFSGLLSYLFIFPAVVMFVAFVAYPILWVAIESFYGRKGSHSSGALGLDQYWRAFADPVFWRVLANMFLWGLIAKIGRAHV